MLQNMNYYVLYEVVIYVIKLKSKFISKNVILWWFLSICMRVSHDILKDVV